MTRACVFCGGKPLTVEDVIPKWVSKLMPVDGLVSVMQGDVVVRTTDKIAVLTKTVCETCNNGWMADLEGLMKAGYSKAILGARPVMDWPHQRLAATWAAKTMLLRLLAKPSDVRQYDPARALRYIYDHREPHPDWRVWIALMDAEAKYIHWEQAVGIAVSDPDRAGGVMTTISVGYLVFHMLALDPDEPADARAAVLSALEVPEHVRPRLAQVWPMVEDEVAAPEAYFTMPELRQLYRLDGGPVSLRRR